MKEPTTLKLHSPIKHGEEIISELTIRRPLAGDLRDFPGEPKMGDILDLAARLSNQPPSVINRLEMEDAFPVMKIVGNFIGTGQGTGKS